SCRHRTCLRYSDFSSTLVESAKTEYRLAALGQGAAPVNSVLGVVPGKIEEPVESSLANKLLKVAEQFARSRRAGGIIAVALPGGRQAPFGEPARFAVYRGSAFGERVLCELIEAVGCGLGPRVSMHSIGVDQGVHPILAQISEGCGDGDRVCFG